MCFFVTPLVRPFKWQQFVFTYLIPIIPFCFAWDGAISNIRTYTIKDLDELLKGLPSAKYSWGKGVVDGNPKMIYLRGMPEHESPD
jgi:hypothetical protein